MVLHNYNIPQNITEEDDFMYKLMNKLYTNGSHYGFIMGDLNSLIKDMKKDNNISNTIIAKTENISKIIEAHLKSYDLDLYEFVLQRYEKIGSPLSLEAHRARKSFLDKKDEYKSEYYDR